MNDTPDFLMRTELLLGTEKLDKLLKKYDLLFDSFEFDADKAMEIICLDKKSDGNSINYIFVKSIGVCEIVKMSKDDKFIVEQRL